MKRIFYIVPLLFLNISANERKADAKHLYQLKRSRPTAGIKESLETYAMNLAQLRCAYAQLRVPDAYKEKVVVGTVEMPAEGQSKGIGHEFSFVADTKTATVTLTFATLEKPVVTATACTPQGEHTLSVVERSGKSVTFRIHNFIAGTPTLFEFHAIQLEETQDSE